MASKLLMAEHYTWVNLINIIGQMELVEKDSKMAPCTRANTNAAHTTDGVAKSFQGDDTTSESGIRDNIMETVEDMNLSDISSKKGGLRITSLQTKMEGQLHQMTSRNQPE